MQIQNEMPDGAHMVDQADDDSALPPEGHPALTTLGRVMSDTLLLWRLCESAHCKRGGRCMGIPPACLKTCLPLLSDEVREGGVAFLEGKLAKLSFDELLAESEKPVMAMIEWCWRMEGCQRTDRKRPSAAP